MPSPAARGRACEVGGLVRYGIDLNAIYHRAAYFVDTILKGEKQADLPIEVLSKPELVINLATAKALGLAVPQALLVRANGACSACSPD